jgi:hypothetical protein
MNFTVSLQLLTGRAAMALNCRLRCKPAASFLLDLIQIGAG